MASSNLGSLAQALDQLSGTDEKMPFLFIGHGNPMNAIEDNEFSRYWQKLGHEIPRPKAVLCISAHWLTKGTYVTSMDFPKTIHDFGGFPTALSQVQYPAPGSAELAKETQSLISSTNVGLDHDWGLDHGCWIVVKQMYPDADIPVLQLSIDYHKPAEYHYGLAQEIKALRKKGVLILGSGNMVHNLRMVQMSGIAPNPNDSEVPAFGFDWALEINETFKKHILSGNHKALLDYQSLGEAARLAIPTPDHYYPLIYTLGLQENSDDISLFNDKCLAGSLSMTSVLWQ